MMDLQNLTDLQMDVLREIGNVGAGNAATSMAKLMNKKVDMKVPAIKVIQFEEVMDLVGGPEKMIAAIIFRIQGEAPGTVFFILNQLEASVLVDQITNHAVALFDEYDQVNTMAISVLQEIGNILTGSYLSALSDFTGINMQPSVPYFGMDMASAILVEGLLTLANVSDYALIVDTQINGEEDGTEVTGQFLLLPDPESFPKMFHSLGITGYE
ncbi:chemotaxis protein CheC [Virgibacillus soli]|uniref:Chemotaxis protein CheC n=1 Tax=Paracerasibacillus soli TaxID=480284 RepID=A0ABU5CPA1_9BACI|nr:chemotaxis protein CheC [Virgibacillus soli]MDY0408182.1 chemotaxis protein CheC [Virgibacillus soli]